MVVKQRSTGRKVGRFIQEWVIVAPIGIWLGLMVSGWTTKDVVSPQIQSGALITFGLSVFLAFYHDLPVDEWDNKGKIWAALPAVLMCLYWALILISVFVLNMVLNASASGSTADTQQRLFVSAFSIAIVTIGLLIGVGGLVTRIRKGTA
jgi:hypothetical protein